MTYIRDTAIVLKYSPYREYDARVTLYGKTHGKLCAIARGSRRSSSRQSGSLQPFQEIEVMIAKGQVFDKLAVARSVRQRLYVREQLGAITVAGVFCDLVERLTRPGESDGRMYNLLCEVLDFAEVEQQAPSSERARLILAAATIRLISILGYEFVMDRCMLCKNALHDSVYIVSNEGCFLCEKCFIEERRKYPNAQQLTKHSISILRFLRACPLKDVLKLTATKDAFASVSNIVEDMLSHTPLMKEPHGNKIVAMFLG